MAKERPSKEGVRRPSTVVESQTSLDVEALRQIVDILEASEVTSLVWRRGSERLTIRRGPASAAPLSAEATVPSTPAVSPAPPPPTRASPAPSERPVAEKGGTVVTSPFVGTFYRTPAPDQPPFVEVGSVVKKGQILCIVEAMKLMNEIESEVTGKVTEILANNGQAVEFGQPLFRIEPV